MVKRLFFMTIALCMLTCSVIAQNLTASGVVISVEDGEPIIGATVRVLGSTTGTITDFDGNFVIEAPEGSSLQFSYVGMITETHKAAKNMHVKMRTDSKNLDEVVVTAMGISKEKKALGYAVQDIKADELSKGANTTLAGALQGKLSGVEITPSSGMPGASSRINIRGSRSFTGDNSPLYVIDGMPIASTPDMSTGNSVTGSDYANRALDLDPNDIESINVLKGQAASALYGLRASNGVIIITTKSGKGASKGKPSVSINTSLSFEKPTTLPDYQKTYAQGWSESALDRKSVA